MGRESPSKGAHYDAAKDIGQRLISTQAAIEMLTWVEEMRQRAEHEITEQFKNRRPDRSEVED